MTLDDLIVEVNSKSLRINNLFQLHDGRWQANITDGERFWEFGRGDTAVEALVRALHKSTTQEFEYGVDRPVRTQFIDRRPKQPAETEDLDI